MEIFPYETGSAGLLINKNWVTNVGSHLPGPPGTASTGEAVGSLEADSRNTESK